MIIISAKSGQLGNRLFTYANYMAFALENRYSLLNPAFDEYSPYFEGTRHNIAQLCSLDWLKFPTNCWMRQKYYYYNRRLCNSGRFNVIDIEREKPFSFSNSDFNRKIWGGKINFIQGWLFREGWFIEDRSLLLKHQSRIKSYFRPIAKHRKNLLEFIKPLKNKYDLIVGIHVRQGDYKDFKGGRYFFDFSDYKRIILSLSKQLDCQLSNGKFCFVIFSNSSQDLAGLDNIDVFPGPGTLIEDMYGLAECDYIIGPPSSYSMWASFYGDKPLYMLREKEPSLKLEDFASFYEWKGRFNAHQNWAKSTWDWFSQRELDLLA